MVADLVANVKSISAKVQLIFPNINQSYNPGKNYWEIQTQEASTQKTLIIHMDAPENLIYSERHWVLECQT